MINFLLKTPDIDDKVKISYSYGYEIGVIIGSYLPFIIVSTIAYLMYNSFKNKNNE
ncbi:MAG: hypothetical protein ACOVQ2_06870 [Flavobacterium sp.]|jgi:hypothetical protein